jgi:hypothetical protein
MARAQAILKDRLLMAIYAGDLYGLDELPPATATATATATARRSTATATATATVAGSGSGSGSGRQRDALDDELDDLLNM